jgi:hypothetical protein
MNNERDLSSLQQYFLQLFNTGALYWLLLPFRVLLAPFFTNTWSEFAVALLPALVIFGVHYWWVMSANVAFEEASIELSRKTADKIAAMRAGQWGVRKPTKAKRSPFQLKTDGSPSVAILWKNLISSGQIFSRRFWMIIIWVVVFTAMMTRSHLPASMLVMSLTAMFIGMSLFIGPQMVRLDFRQDLPMSDVLKTFPMRGWQVVLGEVLAPAVLLSFVQWLLILVFLVASPDKLGHEQLAFGLKLSGCIAAAVALPFLDLIAVLLQNTGVHL